MAEEIKKELENCSRQPKLIPYVCVTAGILKDIMDRVKSLGDKEFLNIYKFAKGTDLPKDFLEELEFEYNIRGFKY